MLEQTEAGEPARMTATHPEPDVRAITVDDISGALTAGMRDFRAAPMFGLVFGGIATLAGILLVETVLNLGYVFLAYPIIAGFTLVAPAAAVGLYETSRRLETGEPVSWYAVFDAIVHHGGRELAYLSM
eukprot:gene31702-36316_t